MSEKQEHRRRERHRVEWAFHMERWIEDEPPRWRFRQWKRWKKNRPVLSDWKGAA